MPQWIKAHEGALFLQVAAVAFLFGALLYSLVNFGSAFVFVLALLAAAFLALSSLGILHVRVGIVSVALAACALGCLRVLLVTDVAVSFLPHIGRDETIVGRVILDPQKSEKSTYVVLEVEEIGAGVASGRIMLFADRGSAIAYGDRLEVRGELSLPEPFETETGATFDYPGYLAAKGIGAVVFRPSIEVGQKASCCSLLGTLFSFKHALEDSIQSVFPEPQGGLLEGMLLGEQDALPKKVTDAFRRSSLVHIVVLSGYNLTVVAVACIWLLSLIPRLSNRPRLILGGISILLFSAMVGFTATVIRAACMALIALVAQMLRRPSLALRSLILAASGMVLYNPLIIVHDPSFVLSFLATFGLITLGPFFSAKLHFVSVRAGLREIASATLATQCFVLPALIFYTGQLSLVALPANILALPLVPASMLFGAIAAGVGLFSSSIAFLPMLPSASLLWLIVHVAQTAAAVPGASIDVARLQTPLIFVSYALLVPLALSMMRLYTKVNGKDAAGMSIL